MSGIELYHSIRRVLLGGGISEGEASALAFMLIEETTGLTKARILVSDAVEGDTVRRLLPMAEAIAGGTPIQHVLGYAWFCGMKLRVGRSVLIPRPETEELVGWASSESPAPQSILDIGTGSGCIAIALAKAFPAARVSAIDISGDALALARENARSAGVSIDFLQADILSLQPPFPGSPYDIVISNPPYICDSEADGMDRNVLEHEPHTALFVPDADPLLFYRAIAERAQNILAPCGRLFFEINRRYAQELTALLGSMGFADVTVRQDQFGNDRMIRIVKS